jgi:peptidoglycan/xylan/chitin deacetylase (PgdA/CDA1 family)
MRYLLVAVLTLLLPLIASAAENSLPNPGFEDELKATWAIADDSSQVIADAARSGKLGLRVGTAETNATGSQVTSGRFAVTPGQEITLTFWARTKAKNGAAYLLFFKADGKWSKNILAAVKQTDGEWHEYSLTAKAPADAAAVAVWVHSYSNSAGTVDLDDFSLAGITPGTQAQPPPTPRPRATAPSTQPVTLPPRAKPPVIILKLDDLRQVKGKVPAQWTKVADYLAERKIKTSFGIICQTLQEATPEYVQWIKQRHESGAIEFWFHGWDHGVHEVDGTKYNEFNGRGYDEQLKRFADSQKLAKEKLGFAFKTFGPPGGTSNGSQNDDTVRAMADDPDMACWLYPSPIDERGRKLEAAGKVVALDRVWAVNLEGTVGSPSAARLIEGFAKNPDREYFVLQGHPQQWSGEKFTEFTKIIDFLVEQKAVFMTPMEYAAIKRKGSTAGPTTIPTPAVVPPAKPAAFKHPGLLNSGEELQLIKTKVAAGEEPWKSAFERMRKSKEASLQWTPRPREIVDVGFHGKPDNGGGHELSDARAAYTHALIWVITGNEEHAKKAAEILDAWSATLQTHTGDNARVQAAWAGSVFPLGAELLKHTYPQWKGAKQFSTMLNRAYVPLIYDGMPTYNGNWELSMCNALVAIGVFNDDQVPFDQGVFLWRKRVPAYFYLTTDGPLPVKPYGTKFSDEKIVTYWHNPGRFVDGLCQETGRDLPHLEMGLSAALNTAEIAYHQGIDLYGEEAKRIVASMEFHANFRLGNAVPEWLCGGTLEMKSQQPTYEIGYNHFHNRLGMPMPLTADLIAQKVRPSWTAMHMAWESLTHAELSRK